MRLKNLFLSIATILTLSLFNCTQGEDFTTFKSRYVNDSGQLLNIKGFNRDNLLEYEYSLNTNEVSNVCSEQSTRSLGPWCGADSILFIFENERGFICTSRNNTSVFCFPNGKSPFGEGEESYYREIDDNSFEFIITEEDFVNAFELQE